MLQSEYDAIVRGKRLKVLLIILTSIMVALVLYAVIKVGKEYIYQPTETLTTVPPKEEETDTIPKSSPEPAKTEFATAFPTDFPADIPVEKEFKLTQSYILDYPEQKQLSIVFPSAKTVKENSALYSDYVEKNGWTVVNKDERDNLSFLYVTKESMEMNVTITENITALPSITASDAESSQEEQSTPSATSQVSVSVLKK